MNEGTAGENGFDPRGLLSALHRNYVSYVLIGGLARVIRGVDEVTSGVDVCPSLRSENVEQLGKALEELEARRADRRRLVVDEESLRTEPVLRLRTRFGELRSTQVPPRSSEKALGLSVRSAWSGARGGVASHSRESADAKRLVPSPYHRTAPEPILRHAR